MAFTFSHTVLAPYLHRLSGTRLPLAALSIGCMLSDISRVVFPFPMAHHFSGMFSINLFCGSVLCLLWYWLYRPIIFAFAQLQQPKPLLVSQYFSFSIYVLLALLIGNFSHLVWDSFTHLDDRTWFGHQFLAHRVDIFNFSLFWHQFLQYTTSLIVLPWLYMGFKSQIQRIPKAHTILAPQFSTKKAQVHLICALFISVFSSLCIVILIYQQQSITLYVIAVQLLKYFCCMLFLYLTILSLYSHCILKSKFPI